MKPCLLIIDGSNFLFRAYHALPPLTNSVGQPTGAIRGTITMLQKLLNDFKPSHVAVTFDHKGRSFRNELYPDYKAHRPPMPDDLRAQIMPLHEIVSLLGLQLIIIEDIEADDAIATLATRGKAANMFVVIASSDKDLAQLVEGDTILFDGMKNQKIDREGVLEKYGVYPELIRDYLALMGDTSDNIPGIVGVGPKTAAKWLNEYGSLDNLIENVKKSHFGGILGINIGKNKDTPVEQGKEDYLICMDKIYPYAGYIAINISSPNTPGLRSLQYGEALDDLLAAIKNKQTELHQRHHKYVPVAVKIAPDLTEEELIQIADSLVRHNIDGVIATNTTLDRSLIQGLNYCEQAGGLSGRPLQLRSTEVIRRLSQELQGRLPIIGVGGIDSVTAAREKMAAGASLIQIYSGFIFRGPGLIKNIITHI